MTTSLKLRRGTTAQHASFTGAEGEVTVDTTKDTVVVHDGVTAGGVPLAKEASLTSGLAAKADTTYVDGRLNTTFAFKNRIINGDMRIDQRNAGASVTLGSGVVYTLDRFKVYSAQASKLTAQQNAGSITPPAGFTKYLGITVASAYTPTSAENFNIEQGIEGNNVTDLAWATSNAKAITISFWVRSSLTGTFTGSIVSGGYSYVYPFVIASANTWTYVSTTIPGKTVGTFATDNTGAMSFYLNLGAGSTLQTATGTWTSGAYTSTSGAVSLVANAGATFYLTGVQLEVGSSATPFDTRAYGTELALCQRYFQLNQAGTCLDVTSGANYGGNCYFGTQMRASSTNTWVSSTASFRFPATAPSLQAATAQGFQFFKAANGSGAAGSYTDLISSSAEL